MKRIELGHLFGLRLTVKPSVAWGSALVWALWSGVGVLLFQLPLGTAALIGPAAVILHWLAEAIHQFGHAWAARRVGHPMTGIVFWGVLSTSMYPKDEGDLAAGVHIRRALGGPFFSLLMSFLGAALLLAFPAAAAVWRWLLLFFFVENFAVLTLQMFVPLGFNDGATLFYWLRNRA